MSDIHLIEYKNPVRTSQRTLLPLAVPISDSCVGN